MGKIAITERVTGHTELIGLIAYPIRHSMSPTMHNEAFKKLGLDYVYVCFEVDNSTLEDTVKGLRAMKVRGWNVSMPNKGPITRYLDKLSPVSQIVGACNTVVNDNGILTGTITDGTSCGMKPLEDVVAIPDKSYLHKELIVMDTVYAPRETKLMRWAEEVGCHTFNGLGMMLYQGAAAFKLWTGKDMPVDYIKDILF